METDPNGKDPHEKGAKLDSGKNRLGLLMDFSRAITAVGLVATYGAKKYTDGGWIEVPNGRQRYTDAMLRHLMIEGQGQTVDRESNLTHSAHVAWNALARLELELREASEWGSKNRNHETLGISE